MIRILIVDDSPTVQAALSSIFAAEPDLEVLGVAGDPYEAVEIMNRTMPDVMTLDLEMPRMDGLTFLRKVMLQRPLPVVVCSTLTSRGATETQRAWDAGAVEVVAKPTQNVHSAIADARIVLCDVVRAAAQAKIDRRPPERAPPVSTPLIAPAGRQPRVVAMGASTGGTDALPTVLSRLPVDGPPTVVVQHMPAGFTTQFAARLNTVCPMTVREARNGDNLERGVVLLAPGHSHVIVRKGGPHGFVEVRAGPLVSRHRPSVDVLFRSMARAFRQHAVGVILTGMGQDGAVGLAEMRTAGAVTVAQDEASSVVFGMAKAAYEAGAVDKLVPLNRIADQIVNLAYA